MVLYIDILASKQPLSCRPVEKLYDWIQTVLWLLRYNAKHTVCFLMHPCMKAYPPIFLEPLSTASAAFAPPLWSVLRIEVKEPLSEGKLGNKRRRREEKGSVWMANQNTIGRKRRRRTAGRLPVGNKSTDSLDFHRASILRHRRIVLESTIINHKGREMRCIIQSSPSSTVHRLKTPLCFSNSQGSGQSSK